MVYADLSSRIEPGERGLAHGVRFMGVGPYVFPLDSWDGGL